MAAATVRTPTTFVGSAGDWLENMLGKIQIPPEPRIREMYPHFHVRAACIKRRPPRHEFFEYFRDMGLADLDAVMWHLPLRTAPNMTFVFPERWLGVAEQHAFMHQLNKHPDAIAGKVKQVDIITSSPLIVGNFARESILIVTFEDDHRHDGVS